MNTTNSNPAAISADARALLAAMRLVRQRLTSRAPSPALRECLAAGYAREIPGVGTEITDAGRAYLRASR